MIEEIAKEAGKSLWKDVGEDALKKAVGTIVSEGIKAVIDVWKQRRLKVQEYELKQSQKAAEGEMKIEKGQEKDGDDDVEIEKESLKKATPA